MSDPNKPVEPWLLKVDTFLKKVKAGFAAFVNWLANLDGKGPGRDESTPGTAKRWSRGVKIWAIAGAGALVAAIIVVPIVVNAVNTAQAEAIAAEEARVAAEERAAEEKAEEEEKEREEKEAKEKRDKQEREALLIAPEKIAEIDAALKASPWAAPEDVATLTKARNDLQAAVDQKSGRGAYLALAYLKPITEMIGTQEEAAAKTFFAALETAGTPVTDPNSSDSKAKAAEAQAWCDTLRRNWSGDRGLAAASLRGSLPTDREAALTALCPDMRGVKDAADQMLADGRRTVGQNVAAGTWRTLGKVTDCYWERSSGSGEILANDFITLAPDGVSVEVYDGEGFTVQGCGLWEKVG
ncbi:hypothetical protein ACFVAJ_17175 [Agromyces sp. NPDC057679]|uniref:hypothetical protein n=1 Tax=Agromyces sp. NPDC057679 TaxID=3346207 RepID=UPI00366B5641